MKDIGERWIYSSHDDTLAQRQHLERYKFASKFVGGKKVLDLASGSGYGAFLLAKKGGAKIVVGVDIDQGSVEYSNDSYGGKNVSFLVGSAEKLPLEDDSVEVVVSFETIEHLPNHARYIREVKRVLVEGGLYIMSTPDKETYHTYNLGVKNKFHISELTRAELEKLLKDQFTAVKFYGQTLFKAKIWRLLSRIAPLTALVERLGLDTLYKIYWKLAFLPGLARSYEKITKVANEKIVPLDSQDYVYILAVAKNGKK